MTKCSLIRQCVFYDASRVLGVANKSDFVFPQEELFNIKKNPFSKRQTCNRCFQFQERAFSN